MELKDVQLKLQTNARFDWADTNLTAGNIFYGFDKWSANEDVDNIKEVLRVDAPFPNVTVN